MGSISEETILKLLSNKNIKHYCENTTFKAEIMDSREAAEILVKIIEKKKSSELARRAGEMLSMCTISAIPPTVKSAQQNLSNKNVLEGLNLLTIAQLIVLQSEFENSKTSTQEVLQEISPILSCLLDDESNTPASEEQQYIEEKYLEYRVCDEALLLYVYLSEMTFDEYSFQEMDYKQRNDMIRRIKGRFQALVA